jgi:hypothetical protein
VLLSEPLAASVIHWRADVHPPRSCHRRLRPTPTLSTQLPGSPASYEVSFHQAPKHPTSRFPWTSVSGTHFVPPTSSASRRCSSCESVHTQPGCPDSAADALLGFVPSRAFSTSTSDPRTHPGARPEHALRPASPSPRPSGPLSPLGRVTHPLTNKSLRVRVVGSPRSPSRSDRTTFWAALLLPWP